MDDKQYKKFDEWFWVRFDSHRTNGKRLVGSFPLNSGALERPHIDEEATEILNGGEDYIELCTLRHSDGWLM